MKSIIVLCALVAFVYSSPETYSTRYDDFDAETVASNERLLKNMINCFLEHGPCTPEASDFRKIIPDALKTSCSKCSPKQRSLIRTVIRGFQAKTPELWQELLQKEDPNGQYKAKLEEFLSSSD